MSKWRELKYYAHGTPTKTTIRLRRRHLFMHDSFSGGERSLCGMHVAQGRLSEGPTEVQKCGHCVKAEGKGNAGNK